MNLKLLNNFWQTFQMWSASSNNLPVNNNNTVSITYTTMSGGKANDFISVTMALFKVFIAFYA